MFFKRWFRSWTSDLTNKQSAPSRRARPRPFRPRLEALEERLTPSTRTWSGAGGNNLWSTAANWDSAPVAGDDLVFPANAARLSNVNDTSIGRAYGSITFTGSGYAISGNRITLNGNGINASQQVSGTNTLDLNITLSGSDQPVTVGFSNLSAGALVLSGLVSGTTGLVKAGPGVLELSGAATNVFSGPLQVNAGTLRLNKSGADAVLGSLVIGDGSGADSVILLGDDQIGDSASVTVNSSGTLNLNNHDDTIGALTLTAGTVATGTGLLTLNGDMTTNAAATASTISGKLSVGGVAARQVTVADGSAASDLIISAALTGLLGAGMAKGGTGKMVLSGANDSFTGTMQVDAGVLRITTNTSLGIAGSAGTTVASGGTLEVAGGLTLPETLSLDGAGAGGLGALFIPSDGGSNTWSGPVTLAGDATIRSDTSSVDFTTQQTISGAIGGSGGLTKTGPGRIQFTSANNYGGVTNVSQGALIMGNAQALGSSAATAGTTVQAGAALETTFNGTSNEVLTLNGNGVPNAFGGTSGALFAGTSATFAGAVTLASDSKVGSNADGAVLTLSGGIGGQGGLTVVGLVAFTGSTPNTYAGNTQVGDGSGGDNFLTLNKSPNTNAIPGGSLTINGLVIVASSEQIPDTVPITGGSLIVNAPETIGPLTLTNGILGGTANVTLAADVTINGFSNFLNSNVSVGDATRTITVNTGGRLDVTNPLTGGPTGSLIKAGPGFLNLKNGASYGGTTTVNAGLLTAGAAVSGQVVVNSGATVAGVGPLVNVNLAGGTLDPGLEIPGTDALGILRAAGAVTFNSTATLHVDLRGPTPGVSNGHDQFNVTGTGTINLGNALLDPKILSGFSSPVNSAFVIVKNDTAGPTNGFLTFRDLVTRQIRVLRQGDFLEVPNPNDPAGGKVKFQISYTGVDGLGKDVVLFQRNSASAFENRAVTSPINEGDVAVLTGTIAEPDPLDTFFLNVNWGDGAVEAFTFPPGSSRDVRLTHRYADDSLTTAPSDTFPIQLSWHDDAGEGSSATLTATVVNVPPSVEAGPNVVSRNGLLTRTVQVSDRGGDSLRATVNFGDGSRVEQVSLTGGSFTLQHRFRRKGTFRVTVTVTDKDGGVATDSFTVRVKKASGIQKRLSRAASAKRLGAGRAADFLSANELPPGGHQGWW